MIIILVFAMHFGGLQISKYLLSKSNTSKLFDSKRLTVYISHDKSLMYHTNHYSYDTAKEYMGSYDNEDDDTCIFARVLVINIGGFQIFYNYGKDFLDDPNNWDGIVSKYFGLYSRNGETFWDDIWWGNHIYNNPFKRLQFLDTTVLNMETKQFEHYDIDNPPLIQDLKSTTYFSQSGPQTVDIKFWLTCRTYVNPILHFLHLDTLFAKHIFELEFETTGIGKEDDWKGKVMGSGILISKEKDELFLKCLQIFKQFKRSKINIYTISLLKTLLDLRIQQFMTIDKSY